MPRIKYEFYTEVRPPKHNPNTGALIEPGGAGRKYIVVPDNGPVHLDKAPCVKVEETPPPERFETPEVKSEDEDEDAGVTLKAQSYEAGPPTTSCRFRGKLRRSQVKDAPSDDSSSDDSEASSSGEDEAVSVFDESSIFRSSKSPSTIVETPSPTTRSRSRASRENQVVSDGHASPCPPSNKGPPQDTPVPRLPSSSFFEPIRRTDCQGIATTPLSSPSAAVPTPPPQSVASPASSRVHGWKPINRQRKAAEPSSSPKCVEQERHVDMRDVPTAPATMRGPPRVVFICNIPFGFPDEQLHELLNTVGELVNFRYTYDKVTGRPKGYGLAEYSDSEAAAAAVHKFTGYNIMGRQLHAKFDAEYADLGNDKGPAVQHWHESYRLMNNASSDHPSSSDTNITPTRPHPVRIQHVPATRPRASSQYHHTGACAFSPPYRAATAGPSTLPAQYRAATAGPSTLPAQYQSFHVQPSPKGKGNGPGQPQSLPVQPALKDKGKDKAVAAVVDDNSSHDAQHYNKQQLDADSITSKKRKHDGNHEKEKKQKKKKRKDKHLRECEAEAKDLEQHAEAPTDYSTRHGPPRHARIERSIEESPCPGLPTPEPSSSAATHRTPKKSSFTRAESSMFVSQPTTPAPQQSSPPMDSFPPVSASRKRCRSVFEDSAEAALNAVANKLLVRFERIMTVGADRLEKKMRDEVSQIRTEVCVEREKFEHRINQQISEHRTEREQFKKGWEERVSSIDGEGRHERKRLETSTAELGKRITALRAQVKGVTAKQDTRIATLHEKFKDTLVGAEKKISGQAFEMSVIKTSVQTLARETESKLDGQASRLRALNGRLDAQTARTRVVDGQIDTNAQKLGIVAARVDGLAQTLDTVQTRVEERGKRVCELGKRVDEQQHQMHIRIDESANTIKSQGGQIDRHTQKFTDQSRENEELKQRLLRLEESERTLKAHQLFNNDKFRQLEEEIRLPTGRGSNYGDPRPQAHYVRPREASDSLRGGLFPRKAVIPNTFVRNQNGGPAYHYGSSASRASQGGGSMSSGRPNEGALDQYRSTVDNHTSQRQYEPRPSSPEPSPAHDLQSSAATDPPELESRPPSPPLFEPASSPADSHQILGIQSSPARSSLDQRRARSSSPVSPFFSSPVQLARRSQRSQGRPRYEPEPSPTPTPPPAAMPRLARVALPPNPASPVLPSLTQQQMKNMVLNHPPSGLSFSVPYDAATDGDQTTAATAFLLNVPLHTTVDRFRSFINRPAFAFNLDDPDVRRKGCWAVRINSAQDGQFKLYYGAHNHSFALNRVAARIWHDEDSVLRLLISKTHEAIRLCRNKSCFNPDHIVVESRKEGRDRRPCARAGYCLQGESVAVKFLVDAALKEHWTVHAITRAACLNLQPRYFEANLDDKASPIEASRSSDVVFGHTDYWERANPDDEIQQGKNLADAVKETGVPHYIWSSLLNITEQFGDMLASRRAIGVPATCFIPGFYMSNFGGGIPSDLVKASHPDKASTLAAPIVATSPISVLHTSDTGAFIQAKVLHLDDVLGKRLLGATAYLAVQEIPDTFKRVYPEAGATARLFQVPEDISRGFMAAQGLPGAGHLRVVRKCQDA